MRDALILDARSSFLNPRSSIQVAKNWGLTRNLSYLIHAMEEFGVDPNFSRVAV
jgi:hypothetical protein